MAGSRSDLPVPPGGERPLTARSVIASVLLGVDPPRLPTPAIVRTGALFGITEGAVRTAMSRMNAAGELEPEGDGYRLAGSLAERAGRQAEGRAGIAGPWDGTWEVAIVHAERRDAAERAALRRAVAVRKLVAVGDRCFVRPANLDDAREPRARAVLHDQCVVLTGASPDDEAPLVAAFDLAGWAERARTLLDAMAAAQPALDRGDHDALGPTFVLDAAVIRHLTADPLLPDALLPDGWPGPALRAAHRRFDGTYKQVWRSWFRTLEG